METARTVPPREHGGNCDIKDLTRGSKVFFPVYVSGAGLSVGDLSFAQGDGEITFCGAIEMAGDWVHMRVQLIKEEMEKYGIKNLIFKPSPLTPNYNDFFVFEGISVDLQGKQYYLDVNVAYKQACLNVIEYLAKFGYSPAQRDAILGSAPIQEWSIFQILVQPFRFRQLFLILISILQQMVLLNIWMAVLSSYL